MDIANIRKRGEHKTKTIPYSHTDTHKMTTVKFSDIVTFAWSYTSSRCVDMYRNAFSEAITITTKSGPVKGYKIPSAFDFHYYNFCGIPYAKPPIGDLRFKVRINVFLLFCNGNRCCEMAILIRLLLIKFLIDSGSATI